MTSLIDSLSEERVFNIFVPDISLEEAQKNEPYVLRVVVPIYSSFLGLIQVPAHPMGIALAAGRTQTAYAFLCDPKQKEQRHFYTTPVFSERPFPWHHVGRLGSAYEDDGGKYLPILCSTIGITSHNGLSVLHVRTEVAPKDYEQFESELKELHYRLVLAMVYNQSEMIRQSGVRAG